MEREPSPNGFNANPSDLSESSLQGCNGLGDPAQGRYVYANDDTGVWEVRQPMANGYPVIVATFTSESYAYEFAAAPDLYAALESVLKRYAPDALTCAEWALDGNTQTDRTLKAARAALRKAKP